MNVMLKQLSSYFKMYLMEKQLIKTGNIIILKKKSDSPLVFEEICNLHLN